MAEFPYTPSNRFKAFWPDIIDVPTAAKAVKNASQYAYWVAGITAAVAVLAMFYGPIAGIDGYNLLDAALMLFMGWRISKFSQTWTILAIGYYIVSMLLRFSTQPSGSAFSVVAILILLGFINGLRGIRGFNKFSQRPEPTTAV